MPKVDLPIPPRVVCTVCTASTDYSVWALSDVVEHSASCAAARAVLEWWLDWYLLA